MNDSAPTSSSDKGVEVEILKVFASNMITDVWYAMWGTLLLLCDLGLMKLGPEGGAWSTATTAVLHILAALTICFILGYKINLLMMRTTEGDPASVAIWCRWTPAVPFLRLHTHSFPRFKAAMDQFHQQQLQHSIV